MEKPGRFGPYGGQYITETLMNAVMELDEAYNKYKKEHKRRLELENDENSRKLYAYKDQFKQQKENKGKEGFFLAVCYFDTGIRNTLFIEYDKKVKQALEEAGLYEEMSRLDWYASRSNGYFTEFYVLNDGFDWYLDRDELYYATPGKPKKRHKR